MTWRIPVVMGREGKRMDGEILTGGGSPGRAEDAVRREIEAAYARAGEAYKRKDAVALMRMVTPDFAQIMPDGQIVGYDQAEAGLTQWFTTADTVTGYSTRLGELSLEGEEAVTVVDERVVMDFADAGGGRHERIQASSSHVTWVRTQEGWRIRRVMYVSGRTTVDGVPV